MKKIPFILFMLTRSLCFAQEQLTDFNPGTSTGTSSPEGFFTYNNTLFFHARDRERGKEVWKTDGTGEGTGLLRDISLGEGGNISGTFLEFRGKLYFIASDGVGSHRIWASDGTGENTHPVTGELTLAMDKIVHDGEFIYFFQRPAAQGLEVWKTDGTPEGTTLVKGGMVIGGVPANLTSALGLVFFSVGEPETGGGVVWRTDGTEQGTFKISGALEGTGAEMNGRIHPTHFVEYDGALYFVARPFSYAPTMMSIMRTDGTPEGTLAVAPLYEGAGNVTMGFGQALVHNNRMYFSFFDVDNKRFFIWESQGLGENSANIYDFSGSGFFTPSYISASGEHLLFTSGNEVAGTSLIKWNVTTGIPETVTEIAPPQDSPAVFFPDTDVSIIVSAGAGKFFIKSFTTSGDASRLLVTDGSAGGTKTLSAIARYGDNLTVFEGDAYYAGASEYDFELWKSDGTEAGTGLVREIYPSGSGAFFGPPAVTVNNGGLFAVQHHEYGYEVLLTDGTSAGTAVVDLRPGPGGSGPMGFVEQDSRLFFICTSASGRPEVCSSDGTAAGTKVITDFSYAFYLSPKIAGAGDGRLYLAAGKADNTQSLYSFDIASGQEVEIKNFGNNVANFPFGVNEMTMLHGTVYLMLTGEGSDLWKSDGTAGGTVKVADLFTANGLVGAGDLVYFREETSDYRERELYRSDGTPEGTVMVKNLNGDASGDPGNLFAFQDKLLFTAYGEGSGNEPWITDGTEANTIMLKDIAEGVGNGMSSWYAPGFTLYDGAVYFAATDDEHGTELWRTDGTPAGTVLVRDIFPGAGSSRPTALVATDQGLFFAAYTPENGYELWRSNGTAAGTRLHLDLAAGPAYSNPQGIVQAGESVVFNASTPSTGRQLWSFSAVTSATEDVEISLSVYPNPSPGILRIRSAQVDGASLAVHDAQGKVVLSVPRIRADQEIDLTHLTAGLYLMRICKGRQLVTVKVVKR